jgi:hypothetical protein
LAGDPRFLYAILKCIDLCRILGLDAPTNIRVSNCVQPTLELLAARRLRVENVKLRVKTLVVKLTTELIRFSGCNRRTTALPRYGPGMPSDSCHAEEI